MIRGDARITWSDAMYCLATSFPSSWMMQLPGFFTQQLKQPVHGFDFHIPEDKCLDLVSGLTYPGEEACRCIGPFPSVAVWISIEY